MPIILDLPSGREVSKENINEMMTILATDFINHQIIASLSLNGKIELMKERLNSIMNFKKKSVFIRCAALMLTLFFMCGFAVTGTNAGGKAAGSYTNYPSSIDTNEKTMNQQKQQNASVPSPIIAPNLTLVEKEYTEAEIDSMNISGVVVEALSENVSIIRRGDRLRVEYYTHNLNDYTLQNELDDSGSFSELTLRRISTETSETTARIVIITIPENINFKTIGVNTTSGNIHFENCVGENGVVDTLSGQVLINGGSFTEFFSIKTNSSTALISGTILPVRGVNFTSAEFHTENGIIMFQPAGSVWDHRYRLKTGEIAQIFVNGKQYLGGGGNINNFSRSQINVEVSNSGTLIVQDFSMGKLSIETSPHQILKRSLTNKTIPRLGYMTMTDYYLKVCEN